MSNAPISPIDPLNARPYPTLYQRSLENPQAYWQIEKYNYARGVSNKYRNKTYSHLHFVYGNRIFPYLERMLAGNYRNQDEVFKSLGIHVPGQPERPGNFTDDDKSKFAQSYGMPTTNIV